MEAETVNVVEPALPHVSLGQTIAEVRVGGGFRFGASVMLG
jgi:hypothetical protein